MASSGPNPASPTVRASGTECRQGGRPDSRTLGRSHSQQLWPRRRCERHLPASGSHSGGWPARTSNDTLKIIDVADTRLDRRAVSTAGRPTAGSAAGAERRSVAFCGRLDQRSCRQVGSRGRLVVAVQRGSVHGHRPTSPTGRPAAESARPRCNSRVDGWGKRGATPGSAPQSRGC